MTDSQNRSSSYIELMRLPRFSIFWMGRVVSDLGDVLFTMATMWYVLSTTGSALLTALVPLMPMLAFLFLAVPLGTVADRLPKKFVLVGTDVARGIVVGGIYILMLLHLIHAFDIYIANILISIAGMLFGPAQQSALPSFLEDRENQLRLANGVLNATSQAITLFGYAAGGLIVAWLHPQNAVLLDVISFVLSALSFVFLSIPPMRAKASQGLAGFVHDSLEGIRFIWSKSSLRTLAIFAAIINMTGAPLQIFTSVFSKDVLHAGAAGYGYLEASAAVGGLLASLVVGKVSHRLRLGQWLMVSLLMASIALLLMDAFPSLIGSIALFGMANAASALLNIPFATSLQLLAPDTIRGRVMSSFGLLVSFANPLGLVAGGWLTNTLGPRLLFASVGMLAGIMGIFSLFLKTLRDDADLNRGFESSTSV